MSSYTPWDDDNGPHLQRPENDAQALKETEEKEAEEAANAEEPTKA
jgi:hypothetical protein